MYLRQDQILIGTVLGGSSLLKPPKGANFYLSMRDQNETWLQYKMAEMSDYFPEIKWNWCGNTFRCNSSCCERLTELHGLLYEDNNRKVTMDVLDGLRDIGLAIWFLDGGSKTGRNKKNAYINTTKFGPEGSEIVKQYFNEVGMPCNINKDGKRLKVLFSVEGTEVFLKTIAHTFPSFMYHRV